MNKFDDLSISNENIKNEAVVSVIEPKTPQPEVNRKKPTVFSAILATIRQDKNPSYFAGVNLPNLKATIGTFIALIFLSAIVVALWYFVERVIFIPFAMIFLSVSVPCLFLVFFYEFNTTKHIGFSKLLLLIVIGGISYMLLAELEVIISSVFFYQAIVHSIVMPIINNLFLFIAFYLIANFFKGETVSECFMLSAFIVMGYSIFQNFSESFSALFVSVPGDNTPLNITVIIKDNEMLKSSVQNMLDQMFYRYIILPYLYSCWGTILAYLVSYLNDSNKKKNQIPKSMYLLIMLVIILNIIAVVRTSLLAFDLILRVISFVISSFIFFKMLNFSLEEDLID